MRLIATLTEAASIRRYLEGVGLPAHPPTITPPPLHHERKAPRFLTLQRNQFELTELQPCVAAGSGNNRDVGAGMVDEPAP